MEPISKPDSETAATPPASTLSADTDQNWAHMRTMVRSKLPDILVVQGCCMMTDDDKEGSASMKSVASTITPFSAQGLEELGEELGKSKVGGKEMQKMARLVSSTTPKPSAISLSPCVDDAARNFVEHCSSMNMGGLKPIKSQRSMDEGCKNILQKQLEATIWEEGVQMFQPRGQYTEENLLEKLQSEDHEVARAYE